MRSHELDAAEQGLDSLKQRFEETHDPRTKEELAVSALEQVERQLRLTRERRQELDTVEGRLWRSRNRLERLLIQTKGRSWWHAHGQTNQRGDLGPLSVSRGSEGLE